MDLLPSQAMERNSFEAQLCQNTNDLVLALDPQKLIIKYANGDCQKFLGCSAIAAQERALSDFVLPSDWNLLYGLLHSEPLKGENQVRLTFKDQGIVGQWNFSYQKESSLLAGFVRDVTDICHQEKDWKDLTEFQDQLLSLVGHDLRSSFGGIVSVSDILMESQDLSSQEIKEYIEILHSGAQETQLLTENLLQWASCQIRPNIFSPRYVNLTQLCESVLRQNLPMAKLKQVNLTGCIEKELASFCDENMIQAVLRNLIGNALKFTPPGGTVRLQVHSQNGACTIRIQDNGLGMDPDTLINVLEGNSSLTRRGTAGERGSGLGLYLCVKFITLHGGSLQGKSSLNQGTELYFSLPISGFPHSESHRGESSSCTS